MAFRTLLMAGLLAASGAAFAQDSASEQPSQQEQQPPQAQQEREQAKQEARAQLDQIYSEKGRKQAFKIEGRLEGIDAQTGALVLRRENLPPALLLLTQQTDVKVDGKSAAVGQLEPGAEIRASFNLAQGIPVAVKVDAKQPKEKSTR
jgi:hypothetical protein